MSPSSVTLADVLVAIEGDASVPKAARDGWRCSIRRVAKYLARDPAQLPARLGALRYGITRLHHAQLGIIRKTLQNHVVNLKQAIRYFSGLKRLSGRGITFTPPWKALYEQLAVRRLRLGLSSFFRYCSACGIDPASVSDATVEAFIRYTGEVQFTVKPRDLHKQVARCWNRAKELLPDWPPTVLTVPDFRPKSESLPWGAFLPSFVQDIERYLSRLGSQSLLDEDAPDRACKSSTIEHRRTCLRLAASAAVKEGVSIDALRLLADLVSPSVVRVILDHYLAKKGGKVVTFTIDLAERLYSIARVYVKAPEAQSQVLKRYCVKLRAARGRRPGLTAKNMAVIRHFKDPGNRARLKALPGKLFDEALKEQDAPIQAAVKASIALAIQILLVAPMRLANLAALSLEDNVVQVGGIEPSYHLVIPPENVKNDQPLEYPLPKVVNDMLGLHLARFRPRLCRGDSPWLFPGEFGGYKTKSTLSGQIIETISKELGVRVTPHQFRHLAAAFILEKDPANYEFVRRVLGHKNLQTTITFYIGLETLEAVRKFSAMALEDVDWSPAP
ncbi:MAG: tyrosine-type recombinase/integrase [Methyloceanibacter sp.]